MVLKDGAKNMTSNEGTDSAPTRDRIFDFLVRYKQEHDGNSPSMREVADACHVVLSAAHFHLLRLERDHRIHLNDNRSRAIEIVGAAWQPPEEVEDREAPEPDPPARSAGEEQHWPARRGW
jgi:hypothetical protein